MMRTRRTVFRVRGKQQGFTIAELMIATLVFSVILLVITSGIINFTAAYYKGIHTSSTQTTARNVMNVIAQNLQYGGGKATLTQSKLDDPDDNEYLCVGDVQIDYKLGAELGKSGEGDYGVFVTTVDSSGVCKAYAPGLDGRELLGPKMRLTNLSVTPSDNLYEIKAGVAFGESDRLCARDIVPATDPGGCDKAAADFPDYTAIASKGESVACRVGKGSQFCAFSHLSSQVVARFEVPKT